MTVYAVELAINGGFGSTHGILTTLCFRSKGAATAAANKLRKAWDDYEDRANDRQRHVTVRHTDGTYTVDVQQLISIATSSTENTLIAEWAAHCGAAKRAHNEAAKVAD